MKYLAAISILLLAIPFAQAKGPACESIKNQASCERKAGCAWAAPGQSSKEKCVKAKVNPLQKRTHVIIPKPLPAQPTRLQVFGALAVVAPPVLVLYDLQRRVQCLDPPDPLGLGGPGFDGTLVSPGQGNVMIPCWQRRAMSMGY